MNRSSKYFFAAIVFIGMLSSCGPSRRTSGPVYEKIDNKTTSKVNTTLPDYAIKLQTEARTWIGTPYLYGGTGRNGVDCSGMVMNIFKEALNTSIPRNSGAQQEFCRAINPDSIAVGDLIFFNTAKHAERVNHVGIYMGADSMIHASSSRGVIMSNIRDPYYVQHYHSSGRIPLCDKLMVSSDSQKKESPHPIAPEPIKASIKETPNPTPAKDSSEIRRQVREALGF